MLWKPLGYFLVGAGMMVEGDAVLFSAAFLTWHGFFGPAPVFFIAFAGALAGDAAWYHLGTRLNGSSSFFARFIHQLTAPFDAHLRMRPFHTIFISKFAYGTHHLLLARAGMLKIASREFLSTAFSATVLWFCIVGGIGYLFGASALVLRRYFRFAEFALLGGLALFFLLWRFVSARSKKNL